MNRPVLVTVLAILDFLIGMVLLYFLVPWLWDSPSEFLMALCVFCVLCAMAIYMAIGLWRMSPRARRVAIMSSKIVGGFFFLGALACTIWFITIYEDQSLSYMPAVAMALGIYQALIASVFGIHLLILTRPHVKKAFVGIDQPQPAS